MSLLYFNVCWKKKIWNLGLSAIQIAFTYRNSSAQIVDHLTKARETEGNDLFIWSGSCCSLKSSIILMITLPGLPAVGCGWFYSYLENCEAKLKVYKWIISLVYPAKHFTFKKWKILHMSNTHLPHFVWCPLVVFWVLLRVFIVFIVHVKPANHPSCEPHLDHGLP